MFTFYAKEYQRNMKRERIFTIVENEEKCTRMCTYGGIEMLTNETNVMEQTTMTNISEA